MKNVIPIAVAGGVVVLVVAVLFMTTTTLQSPEDKFYSEIDAKVEQAQRMLHAYEPFGEMILSGVESAGLETVEYPPAEEWGKHLDASAFEERSAAEDRSLRESRQLLASLGYEPARPRGVASIPYGQLEQQLRRNRQLIEDALRIVQEGVRHSVEAGDTTLRGTSHPAATELEAVLLQHKADLLRREAALDREKADAARRRFDRLRSRYQSLESTRLAIIGDSRPIMSPGGVGAIFEPVEVEVVETDEAAETAGEAGTPTRGFPSERDDSASGPRQRGLVGRLTGFLFGRDDEAGDGEPEGDTAIDLDNLAGEPDRSITDESGVDETRPDAPADVKRPGPDAMVGTAPPPTPEERIANLNKQRQESEAHIEALEARITELEAEVADLEDALAEAKAEADAARLRMIELEEMEVSPTEPGSLDRFIADYDQVARRYRQATTRISFIENGGIHNAQPGTDDMTEAGDETIPLVPIDSSQQMQARRALPVVKAELDAARVRRDGRQALVALIDKQIRTVQEDEQRNRDRIKAIEAEQASVLQEAGEAIRGANGFAYTAEMTENSALDLIDGPGLQAARNAKNAARNDQRVSGMRDRVVEGTELTSAKILSAVRVISGHAQLLEADAEWLRAQILAQQLEGLADHERMLLDAERMGIRSESDMLPASLEGRDVPSHLLQADAAADVREAVRERAIAAGNAAVETYRQAAGDLDLWLVHANLAAVQHLLARLHADDQRDNLRQQAIESYARALEKRQEDDPDARIYRDILGRLRTTPR